MVTCFKCEKKKQQQKSIHPPIVVGIRPRVLSAGEGGRFPPPHRTMSLKRKSAVDGSPLFPTEPTDPLLVLLCSKSVCCGFRRTVMRAAASLTKKIH